MNSLRIRWNSSEGLRVLAALLTLLSLVVAQSVYEVLAANQAFLALRQVPNRDLIGVIVAFNWLPALALFGAWAVLGRVGRLPARAFLDVVYFLLFAALFLQVHNAYLSTWAPFPRAYWLWLVPAALLAVAAQRFERGFRAFIVVLLPVVLLFPALFLLRTWADREVPGAPPLPPAPVQATSARSNLPPVLLVVLDELPTQILLDNAGQIDPARYPNFHRLAQCSHWFRRATANADETINSIPVILTGDYPRPVTPTAANYPQNLLTWLAEHYPVYAYESLTSLCDPARFHCLSATRQPRSSRGDFLRDVLFLYLDRVVPPDLALGLPDLRRTWGPFRDSSEFTAAKLERFEKALDTLTDLSPQRSFVFFFHHMLPHSPYVLTPDGHIREATPDWFDPKLEESQVNQVLERYRQQVAFTDRQLGRLLDHLEQQGLFDHSLLIVTADHGVSYRPEAPGRALMPTTADLILNVPLLVKLPHQREGTVSDQEVQLIDVVPTIAGILQLELPWKAAGRDIFGANTEPRLKIAYDITGRRHEFPFSSGPQPAPRVSPEKTLPQE